MRLFLGVVVAQQRAHELSPGREPPPLMPHRRAFSRHREKAAAAQQRRKRQHQDVPAYPFLATRLTCLLHTAQTRDDVSQR